jgi:hypothetical protein
MYSIVTISRDRPQIFLNHLMSIITQPAEELIILDDSTEGNDEQEYVIRYLVDWSKSQIKHVKAYRMLERTIPGGVGLSLNYGLRQTTQDHIFAVCGDDIFPTDHFKVIFETYQIMRETVDPKMIIGWPLYHFRPYAANQVVMSLKRVLIDQTELLLTRKEVSPDWTDGDKPYIWDNDVIDDRALYPREFLMGIHGWVETPGANWWRDAQMRVLIQNNGYQRQVVQNSMSFHQYHQRVPCPGDQQAKDFFDNMGIKRVANDTEDWGRNVPVKLIFER